MNSIFNACSKYVVSLRFFSKITVAFLASLVASIILFGISYFSGLPHIDSHFWLAAIVTSAINVIAFPLILKAYEIGEFSSVYSMLLLTPVFLVITSFLFLREKPSVWGVSGVILTVLGLYLISKNQSETDRQSASDFKRGNFLAMLVAFLYSISTNFDKLSAAYSDQFFAPAVTSGMMALGYALYLSTKAINNARLENHEKSFKPQKFFLILILGLILSLANIFHNSALLSGFVSYTIAIKRVGIVIGVFWGWLFFHEHNLTKKIAGAVIAVIGVTAILLS